METVPDDIWFRVTVPHKGDGSAVSRCGEGGCGGGENQRESDPGCEDRESRGSKAGVTMIVGDVEITADDIPVIPYMPVIIKMSSPSFPTLVPHLAIPHTFLQISSNDSPQ